MHDNFVGKAILGACHSQKVFLIKDMAKLLMNKVNYFNVWGCLAKKRKICSKMVYCMLIVLKIVMHIDLLL